MPLYSSWGLAAGKAATAAASAGLHKAALAAAHKLPVLSMTHWAAAAAAQIDKTLLHAHEKVSENCLSSLMCSFIFRCPKVIAHFAALLTLKDCSPCRTVLLKGLLSLKDCSPCCTAHLKGLLSLKDCSPCSAAHLKGLLSLKDCSPCSTAHLKGLLTLKDCSPCSAAHLKGLLSLKDCSACRTAHLERLVAHENVAVHSEAELPLLEQARVGPQVLGVCTAVAAK
eukprot:scaffold129160_cov19-Tisochrysis_lutea.AAC.1